jgi:hypothetical protein
VAQYVTDLWTGDTNWGACLQDVVAQVLCVQ